MDISGHHVAWNRLVMQIVDNETFLILETEDLSFAVNTL